MSLKRVLVFSLCILVLSGLVGCREKESGFTDACTAGK